MAEDKRSRVNNCIRIHPDFPKPGIAFRDIFPVLGNPSVLTDLTDLILQAAKEKCADVECIVGLESRGFLFGTILAHALKIPFVPIRKKGKLPGKLLSVSYQLEYGSDTFEIQSDALKPNQKVLIIDDLLATGGTMSAACSLVEKAGAQVSLCLVAIELSFLKGRAAVNKPLHAILSYDS